METITFERQGIHRRDNKLESLLKEVNGMLFPAEKEAIYKFEAPKFPIIFLVGCPRSGTTLFMQWLASLGYFCYPTNLLSRFYNAPYIGAKIQLMLTKHDFNNELFDFNSTGNFESKIGKTKGALAPNEFWYFWRRFFHFSENSFLEESQLQSVDSKLFISELAAIENAFGMPFALKAMIINWNIPFISSLFDKAVFIHMKRNSFYNIQSILNARKDYFGDIRAWYSFKPPEYDMLKSCDPYEQVAGQVYYTNNAIEKGFEVISDDKKIILDYDEFCNSPVDTFCQLTQKLETQGYNALWNYDGPSSFKISKNITSSDDEVIKIFNANLKITGEQLVL